MRKAREADRYHALLAQKSGNRYEADLMFLDAPAELSAFSWPGFHMMVNDASWPLIAFVLVLIAAICALPTCFMLVLTLQQLPPAISSVALPLGATVAVAIATFLFSVYCVLC